MLPGEAEVNAVLGGGQSLSPLEDLDLESGFFEWGGRDGGRVCPEEAACMRGSSARERADCVVEVVLYRTYICV